MNGIHEVAGSIPAWSTISSPHPHPLRPLESPVRRGARPERSWSDDVLARAIREGIGHDGRALFPMMPYQLYRQMSDEDLASIIVYLRSLPPVRCRSPT